MTYQFDMKTLSLTDDPSVTLCADLFLPENARNVPLVVAASGGGWRRGKRQDLAQWGRFFAQNGIAFATVDYRRAVNGPVFPDNLRDIANAIVGMVDQAADHGIDASRIALLGVSAGAQLTALSYLSDQCELPMISGMACIYGPYDLFAHWQEDLAKSYERSGNLTERMMGCTPFDDPLAYHRASPIRQITSAKAIPVFLSWGLLDPAIDPKQSADFAMALQQAGYPVRTRVFPDAGHFWFSDEDITDPNSHAAKVSADLLRFYKRIFT